MTDSTMVERVALVFAQHGDHFFDNDGPSNTSWDDFSPREQLVATAAARAAIEAMMEPSICMEAAAVEIDEVAAVDWVNALFGTGIGSAQQIIVAGYRAMLSAALRSSLKGEGE